MPGLRMRLASSCYTIGPHTGRLYVPGCCLCRTPSEPAPRCHLTSISSLHPFSHSHTPLQSPGDVQAVVLTSPPRPGRRSCGAYAAVASVLCPVVFVLGWSARLLGSCLACFHPLEPSTVDCGLYVWPSGLELVRI